MTLAVFLMACKLLRVADSPVHARAAAQAFDAPRHKKMLTQDDKDGREASVTVKDNSEAGKSKKANCETETPIPIAFKT
jgi:hypothetical protein